MAGLFASTRALSKMTDDKEELKAAESAKAALSIAPLSEPATNYATPRTLRYAQCQSFQRKRCSMMRVTQSE